MLAWPEWRGAQLPSGGFRGADRAWLRPLLKDGQANRGQHHGAEPRDQQRGPRADRGYEQPARRETLIARREERGGEVVYVFDIHLQGDRETVFFDV